jgi:RNA polymerase sigma-70 factor (ECF subfamily)
MSANGAEPDTRPSLLVGLRERPDDQAAWVSFVRRYGPMVDGWCRAWGLQPADAEDVTQTVLLKLAVHLRAFQYDPSRRFRGYLKTVAHNAWVDFVTARKRGIAGSGDTAVLAALQTEPARDDLAVRMEQEFDRELLQSAEKAVQARVEPHTWEAFRLTAIDGLSGAEAAAKLGMQVGTVFKAKSKVQKMLRDEVDRLDAAIEARP